MAPHWRERLTASLRALFAADDPGLISDLLSVAEWIRIPGGQRLVSQGDPGDSMYIVVSGRLMVRAGDGSGGERVLGDVRPGESVGEMGLLGSQPRTATVEAVRDSVAVRLSERVFKQLAAKHPTLVAVAARLIVRRASDLIQGHQSLPLVTRIAIVPLRGEVWCGEFARRLGEALQHYAPSLVLDHARSASILAAKGLSRESPLEQQCQAVFNWLDEQERLYATMIYQASSLHDPWTEHLVRDADRVLLVAPFHSVPEIDPGEDGLLHARESKGPRHELILLHESGLDHPTGTHRWLRGGRTTRQHHIRLDRDEDFRRLARFVTGRAVGVVLSGGGARGFAHLGVVRALREAGIAIDAVGGTSHGALTAACVAMGWSDDEMARRSRDAFSRNPTGDYFLIPYLALVHGKRLDDALRAHFGAIDVEDLWLPMFCVSTNLTLARPEIHRRGKLWKALRASVSVPGILPPVAFGNELHVDGGLLDNLPVTPMREAGVGRVIAVDATVKDDVRFRTDGAPSVLRAISRFIFNVEAGAVGMPTVVMESLMASARQHAADVAPTVDLYLNPQPRDVGLLEWGAVDRCAQFGYEFARRELDRRDLQPLLDRPAK